MAIDNQENLLMAAYTLLVGIVIFAVYATVSYRSIVTG